MALRVEDDGAGGAGGGSAGVGLTDIEQRTRLLGGAARLDSDVGAGTCLEIDVPVPPMAAPSDAPEPPA